MWRDPYATSPGERVLLGVVVFVLVIAGIHLLAHALHDLLPPLISLLILVGVMRFIAGRRRLG